MGIKCFTFSLLWKEFDIVYMFFVVGRALNLHVLQMLKDKDMMLDANHTKEMSKVAHFINGIKW